MEPAGIEPATSCLQTVKASKGQGGGSPALTLDFAALATSRPSRTCAIPARVVPVRALIGHSRGARTCAPNRGCRKCGCAAASRVWLRRRADRRTGVPVDQRVSRPVESAPIRAGRKRTPRRSGSRGAVGDEVGTGAGAVSAAEVSPEGEPERRSPRAGGRGGVVWRTAARTEARGGVLRASARRRWVIGQAISARCVPGRAPRSLSRRR